MNKPLHKQIEILDQPFDALEKIAIHRAQSATEKYGALSLFVGTMREFNQGRRVLNMYLEHYPEMTQRYIAKQLDAVCHRYHIGTTLVVHRVGTVYPGDTLVAVAVWAAHRSDAIAANHYLVEQLKYKAPFWKKEMFADHSTQWVTTNTAGANLSPHQLL